MTTSSLILKSYLNTKALGEVGFANLEQQVPELLLYNKVHLQGGNFLTPLSYYLAILDDADSVLLTYMSAVDKKKLLRELEIAYLLLLTERRYELEHQKYEHKSGYDDKIEQCKRCMAFIDAIHYSYNPAPSPEHGCASDGKPASYLGLALGQWLSAKMLELVDHKTATIKAWMGSFNETRLYWVWGSVFLKTALDMMPPDFFNKDHATTVAHTPDATMGYLSWTLYYFRFSLNLGLLLKHTISGPWMSAEEQSIPWTQRFLTQWDQRKFTLLNDSLWATANMACFLWLTAKAGLGAWGDLLTIALLVFDLSAALWDFEEQKTKYNKEMLRYNEDILALDEKLATARAEHDSSDVNQQNAINEYLYQLAALKQAQKQCKKDWDYQQMSLYNNVAYASALIVAFILLTLPFLPVAAPGVAAVGIAGAVLCFAFTVIYNAVKGGMAVYKAQTSAKEAKQDYLDKVQAFKDLLQQNPDLTDNEKKFLFLQIKQVRAETAYQQELVAYQTMHLFRIILLEVLLPAVVFASLVFLPLGIGLGALAAVIVLALAANLILNVFFKPKKEELKHFDDLEYAAFCQDPDHWDARPALATASTSAKKPKQADPAFFKSDPAIAVDAKENNNGPDFHGHPI
ncbi:MAG: hypothetical protein ACHP65_06730 [Legionellales bacterium]